MNFSFLISNADGVNLWILSKSLSPKGQKWVPCCAAKYDAGFGNVPIKGT